MSDNEQTVMSDQAVASNVQDLSWAELNASMKNTLDELSKEVYGTKSAWRKMVKKGELLPGSEKLPSGETRNFKRWQPLTLGEVVTRMVLLKEKNEAEAKAASEKQEGEQNVQSNEDGAGNPSPQSDSNSQPSETAGN
jgi:hypothetical protein